ncbi:hypothetical protein LWI29_021252 [Acer saccharum]|uniref:Retrotransposon Copia-like N-terminal domain-containing protein n=1 Tax=Acer saccharum TaxID=4024 RepID=A0AA39RSD6_ACESA|nr:hypothetical protein LWI29_021252 [Acer saccharum]
MAPATTFSVPNITHIVSVKLTDTNYLLWQTQIKPFLIGQNYWHFIDGSFPQPSQFLPQIEGKPAEPNPDYTTWFQTDQTLVSLINSTLFESILSQVVGLNSSQAIWNCLQQNFSQQSLANATHFCFQLLSIQKGTKSISEYLQHAKSLSDSLAAINELVSNTDLVSSVLRGLGPDYSMIVTAILNFPRLPLFNDLRARLLSFETQIAPPPSIDLTSQTAFVSTRGRGRNYRGGRSGRGNRGGHETFGNNNNPKYRSPQNTSILGPHPQATPPRIQCQICNKFVTNLVTLLLSATNVTTTPILMSFIPPLLVCKYHNQLIQIGILTLVQPII